MRRTAMVFGALGALLVPATTQAAAPDGSGPWADRVASSTQGTEKEGAPVRAARRNPSSALGVAERGSSTTTSTSFSLGFINTTAGGQITLGYDNLVCNGAGPDIELVEETAEPYTQELVDVFVSRDGASFDKVADNVNKDSMVPLPASVGCVRFVRLVDQTIRATSPRRADGYDVDGVRALYTEPQGAFSCSANALRVDLLAIDLVNANEASSPCVDDSETLASTPPALPVSAMALKADTDANPGGNLGGKSTSSVTNVLLTIGTMVITADVVESEATVSCSNGTPQLAGSSRIVNLNGIAGNPALLTGPVTINLPLGLGTVYLNRTVNSAGRVVQRAIEYDGPSLLGVSSDIVVAETEADFSGNPCP